MRLSNAIAATVISSILFSVSASCADEPAAPQPGSAPQPLPGPAPEQPPPGSVLPPSHLPPNSLPPAQVALPVQVAPPLLGAPRVLKWHEGDPIPPGYHKGTSMRTGLVIIGSVTFGTAWVPSAILGSFGSPGSRKHYQLVIPVVGPFIVASVDFHSDGGGLFGGLLVLDGIQQAAGLAIWIAGLAAPKTVLVRSDVKAAKTWWLPTPMSFGKGSAGLGILGTM